MGKALAIKEHGGIFVCDKSSLHYICGRGDMTTYGFAKTHQIVPLKLMLL